MHITMFRSPTLPTRGPSPEQVAADIRSRLIDATPDVFDNVVRAGLATYLLQANMARVGFGHYYRCVAK
jgi:hypothetical protein